MDKFAYELGQSSSLNKEASATGRAVWEGSKFIPVAGAVPSFIDAGRHFTKGNWGQGLLETGGGLLSLTGIGALGKLGLGGAKAGVNAARAGMAARAANAGKNAVTGAARMAGATRLGQRAASAGNAMYNSPAGQATRFVTNRLRAGQGPFLSRVGQASRMLQVPGDFAARNISRGLTAAGDWGGMGLGYLAGGYGGARLGGTIGRLAGGGAGVGASFLVPGVGGKFFQQAAINRATSDPWSAGRSDMQFNGGVLDKLVNPSRYDDEGNAIDPQYAAENEGFWGLFPSLDEVPVTTEIGDSGETGRAVRSLNPEDKNEGLISELLGVTQPEHRGVGAGIHIDGNDVYTGTDESGGLDMDSINTIVFGDGRRREVDNESVLENHEDGGATIGPDIAPISGGKYMFNNDSDVQRMRELDPQQVEQWVMNNYGVQNAGLVSTILNMMGVGQPQQGMYY